MNLTDVLAKDRPKEGPEWVAVDSSRIEALIYSAPDRLLLVKFHGPDNPTYVYADVSESIYEGLLRADKADKSVGDYFQRYVVDAGKKYTRFYTQE
jgi:KTSC domain